MSRLLTLREAAAILRHTVSGTRKLIRQGAIKGYRVGGRVLLKADELERYVEVNEIVPARPGRRKAAPAERITRAAHLRESALEGIR